MKANVNIVRVQEASNKPEHKGLLRVTVIDASIKAEDRTKDNFIDTLHSMVGKDGNVSEGKKEFVRKLIEASKSKEALDVELTQGDNGSMWLNPESYAIDDADAFLANF